MDVIQQPATLNDLITLAWRAKYYWLTTSLLAFILAAAFLITVQPYYKATLIIAPANPMQAPENIAQVTDRITVTEPGSSAEFVRFENTYSGPSVAALLLNDKRIVDGLKQDYPYSALHSDTEWNKQRLAAYIETRVQLYTIGATPLRRMEYLHPDAEFAAYFLARIHTLTDSLIRQIIRGQTLERIRYLREQLGETRNPEHRRALTDLLLEQERQRMLVSIEQPYAATIIEPAASGHKPKWPDMRLFLPFSLIIGAAIGFALFGLKMQNEGRA